jgi:uncharacterized protein (DUF427 family)
MLLEGHRKLLRCGGVCQVNDDAAWYYPDPSSMAASIKDHVAFWHGVKVEE